MTTNIYVIFEKILDKEHRYRTAYKKEKIARIIVDELNGLDERVFYYEEKTLY